MASLEASSSSSTEIKLYIILWASFQGSFRLPELESIAKLSSFSFHLPPFSPELIASHKAEGCGLDSAWDIEGRPALVIGLESEEHAHILTKRSIALRTIHSLYHMAPSFEELNDILKSLPQTDAARPWQTALASRPSASSPEALGLGSMSLSSEKPREVRWKWRVEKWGRIGTLDESLATFQALEHLKLGGIIDLRKPEVELTLFYEYLIGKGLPEGFEGDQKLRMVFFGRLVATGTARALAIKYDLKKRAHIGNTSMESEVSLLMANQALARSGACVWDPFAGTGSMLLTCAEWGSYCWGSDIDGRQMMGKKSTTEPGIVASSKQYGTTDHIVDLLIFDVTKSPMRYSQMFDAIVTDPPYGVRAGAKRLGRKDPSRLRDTPYIFPEGHPLAGMENHKQPGYYPPTRPYELAALATDLVLLARYALKPGGRLVFFLPVVNATYSEVDIPVVEGMKLVANSIEDFGKWARRLITFELDKDAKPCAPPAFDSGDILEGIAADNSLSSAPGARRPGHYDFRSQYFVGFEGEAVASKEELAATVTVAGANA